MDTMTVVLASTLNNLDSLIETTLNSLGILGSILSCFLIMIESILPMLPLCVFITILFYAYGKFLGFVISWVFTVIGCMLSFSLCRTKLKGWFERKLNRNKEHKKIDMINRKIENLSLSGIAVLVAIPFTPAFVVNIAAGLSNMSRKKFFIGILIGKIFMVYFWGYIGTTLIESITHPIYLIRIIAIVLIAFILSKIVDKFINIE